jgi:Tol biopolymer transport system component
MDGLRFTKEGTMSRLHHRLAFAISVLALLLTGMAPVFAQDATPASDDLVAYAPAEATRLYALSPDGTMVIGAGQEEQSLCTFAVPSGDTIACANLNERRINLREEDIRWSPNSHEVVFAERAFVYFKDGDIWTFDAQTGELTDLTDEGDIGKFSPIDRNDQTKDVYFDVAPAWSPDGAQIAFSRTTFPVGSDDTPNDLMTVDVATGEVTTVANFDPTFPGALYFGMGWSPDGGTIYASAGYSDPGNPRSGVWAFDAGTGEGTQLAGPSEEVEGAFPALLAVSPAGDTLTVDYPAFLSQYGFGGRDGSSGYGLLTLADSSVTLIDRPVDLTEHGFLTAGPNYAPDGETLVYGVRSLENNSGLVLTQSIESGDVTVLATLPDDLAPITINPGVPIQVGANGAVFIQTSLESGYLLTLPDDYLTPPALPEATATPATSPEVSVAVGSVAVSGVDTVMRSGPSVDSQVVLVLQPGAEVVPLGDPVEADGESWVPVRDAASGTIGYVRASDLES